MSCNLITSMHTGCGCRWISKHIIKKIPKDDENRLIISIKFGLICIKPYLIMITKHKSLEIVYQILQFCSLIMISYLTYVKMYSKLIESNIVMNQRNDQLSVQTQRTRNDGSKYIFTKFEDSDANKCFGIFYLISYIVANFASYFILIMLMRYQSNSSFKSEWILLVYIPYIWIFFSKLYHNEIVRYFTNLKKLTKDSSMIDIFKVTSRIDKIIFWLKMLIFSTLLCFVFCADEYTNNFKGDSIVKSLWLVQLVCTGCMFVNSSFTLTCFATRKNHQL